MIDSKNKTVTGGIDGTIKAALLAGALLPATMAHADEADARAIFQAMSTYLGSQSSISFDFDATLDVVTDEGQKLSIASSGAGAMERPNKLHASRHGGFATVEIGFDGETLTVVNTHTNQYAEVDVQGSVENLINLMRETYGRPLPAADLLSEDFAGLLLPMVTDVKDLGSGVIGGVECDHVALRTEDFDLQVWVAQGTEPYPCRYSITSPQIAGSPDYRVDVRNWKTGLEAVAAVDFSLPSGASKVEITAVPDLDDLGGIYAQ